MELKTKNASDFREGDIIKTGSYFIYIRYKSRQGITVYGKPGMCSNVEKGATPCGCTPGVDRPYYIDDFLSR
jgi:hypothetical protein